MIKEFFYYIKTDWKECVRVYFLLPNAVYQALKKEFMN